MKKANILFFIACITCATHCFSMKQQVNEKKESRGESVFLRFLHMTRRKCADSLEIKDKPHEKNKKLIEILAKNMITTCITEAKEGSKWINKMLEEDGVVSSALKILGIEEFIKAFIKNSENKEIREKMEENVRESIYNTQKKYLETFEPKTELTIEKKDNILSKKVNKEMSPDEVKDLLTLSIFFVKENQDRSLELFQIIRPTYTFWNNPIYWAATTDFVLKNIVGLVTKSIDRIEQDIEKDIIDPLKLEE